MESSINLLLQTGSHVTQEVSLTKSAITEMCVISQY